MENTFNNIIEKLKSKQEFFRIENINIFEDLCNKILIEVGLEDDYTYQLAHNVHNLINAGSALENEEWDCAAEIEALLKKAKEKVKNQILVDHEELKKIELLIDKQLQYINDKEIVNNIFSKISINKNALKNIKTIHEKYYSLDLEDEAISLQHNNELRNEIEIIIKQYNKNAIFADYFEIVKPIALNKNEKFYILCHKNLVHESLNYIAPKEPSYPKNEYYIKLQHNDIILLTRKNFTLYANRVFTESTNHVITNNVTVIRTSKINTSYLICLFNNYLFEYILKRSKNGSINTSHLKQITLPIVNKDLENYFAIKVTQYNQNNMEYTKLDGAIKTANEIAEKQGIKGAQYYLELEKII